MPYVVNVDQNYLQANLYQLAISKMATIFDDWILISFIRLWFTCKKKRLIGAIFGAVQKEHLKECKWSCFFVQSITIVESIQLFIILRGGVIYQDSNYRFYIRKGVILNYQRDKHNLHATCNLPNNSWYGYRTIIPNNVMLP